MHLLVQKPQTAKQDEKVQSQGTAHKYTLYSTLGQTIA